LQTRGGQAKTVKKMVRVFWAKIENICTHIPAITYGFLNTSPGSLFFSPKKGDE